MKYQPKIVIAPTILKQSFVFYFQEKIKYAQQEKNHFLLHENCFIM